MGKKKILSSLHDKERALHAHPVLWNVSLEAPEEPKHTFTHHCIPAAISSGNSASSQRVHACFLCYALSCLFSSADILITIKTNAE